MQHSNVIWAIVSASLLYALIMFYLFIIIPNQNKKNEAKQKAKERAEADKLFSDVSTGFIPRSCEERCYKDLAL